jgi:hypothetical protein
LQRLRLGTGSDGAPAGRLPQPQRARPEPKARTLRFKRRSGKNVEAIPGHVTDNPETICQNQPSLLAAEPSRKQAEPCDFDGFLNYQFGWLRGSRKVLLEKIFWLRALDLNQ